MSNRPEPMSAAEQAAIGKVVAAMRDSGVLWKEIVHELGMSRMHLSRCLRRARMVQKTGRMLHPGDCEVAAAA